MENRNFHTSLLGGFRKKDVVTFLAEEKSRQDAALEDLRQQMEEAEGQLQRLMNERDLALEQVQALRIEQSELRQQLEAAFREQESLEERLNEAALREQAMASQSALSQAEVMQLTDENERLQARVEELEARPEPTPAVDPAELAALREQLDTERQRAGELAELVELLRQQPQSRSGSGERMDQLWSLCGKMERTLGQMERMLDGPYRMTCYPEPPAERCPAEPPVQEPVVIPCEEPVTETQTPSVKTLLQRIRKR
ncbi:MAG: hypothetical protein IKU58_09410 [Clostridia bacterium]|nr:hypothetical protein [Clostridia bacterium]